MQEEDLAATLRVCLLGATKEDAAFGGHRDFKVDRSLTFVVLQREQPVWAATHILVKQLCELVVASLPGFWRIAKANMDGKFTRVSVVESSPNFTD